MAGLISAQEAVGVRAALSLEPRPAASFSDRPDQFPGDTELGCEYVQADPIVPACPDLKDLGGLQFGLSLPLSSRDTVRLSLGVVTIATNTSPSRHHTGQISRIGIGFQVRRANASNGSTVAQVGDKWSFNRRFVAGRQDVGNDVGGPLSTFKVEGTVPGPRSRGCPNPAITQVAIDGDGGNRAAFVDFDPEAICYWLSMPEARAFCRTENALQDHARGTSDRSAATLARHRQARGSLRTHRDLPLVRNRGASPGRVLDGAGHSCVRIIPPDQIRRVA